MHCGYLLRSPVWGVSTEYTQHNDDIRFGLVWFDAKHPGKQFFSHVGMEPPLPGYYQYFFGG